MLMENNGKMKEMCGLPFRSKTRQATMVLKPSRMPGTSRMLTTRHLRINWRWWEERMKRMFRMYDVVRIDHFRGFHSNWAIPYPEDVATNGHWQNGPEDKLFDHIMTLIASPDQIIAEDLGIIPEEVLDFRQRHKLRGMSVLQFGFTDDINTNPHHPNNIREDQIVYTGTHDNNTAEGWFASASDDERIKFVLLHLKANNRADIDSPRTINGFTNFHHSSPRLPRFRRRSENECPRPKR